MKIRLLSDLHTEGWAFKYNRLNEDVLVLAGDIGVGPRVVDFIKSTFPADLPIVFVAGNHEYYKQNFEDTKRLFTESFEGTNVKFLNNDSRIINGVRFLGGTMFSDFGLYGEVYRYAAESDSERSIMDFHIVYTKEDNAFWSIKDHKAEFAKFDKYMKFMLKEPFEGKTVVVSHFLPSINSISDRFKGSNLNPYFASNCEHLMGFSDLWLHGHTHDSFDYEIAGTRVVCNPKGYGAENSQWAKLYFNPNLIIEI